MHYYLYFGLRGEKYIYLKSNTSGEGNGNPLQYSCLESPMEGGAWLATVHGVAKESDTTEWLHYHYVPPPVHVKSSLEYLIPNTM